jgi:hypothetical protein
MEQQLGETEASVSPPLAIDVPLARTPVGASGTWQVAELPPERASPRIFRSQTLRPEEFEGIVAAGALTQGS